MKKRIIILANSLNIGGVEKSLISLLQSLDYNKYEIDLVLKSGGIFESYLPSEVNVINPPKYYKWAFIPKNKIAGAFVNSIGINLNFFRLVYYLIAGLTKLEMTVARQKLLEACIHTLPKFKGEYDIGIDYTGGLKSILINNVNAKKKITWIHSDYSVYRRDKKIDKNDYAKIDSIITVSQTCNKIFISEFPEFEDKCYVIPNITNKDQILKMSNEKIEFDNNFKGFRVIDITRLDPNKGIDIAIRVCKLLIDKGYDVRWYILGEGPERFKLEKTIKENHLEERFYLLGLKSNPYPYIKKSDFVVHCSLFEGKSVAIDEALILEKPIVLTNYPTAKDQIQNNKNGLICDISIEGVFNAVESLIQNKKLKQSLVDNLKGYEISTTHSLDVLEGIFYGDK